jgi:hypothetical protein
VRVGDVTPLGDAVHTAAVLGFDRAADVGEFTVLKEEEVVALCEEGEGGDEFFDGGGGGEGEDVDVSFCAADEGADFYFCCLVVLVNCWRDWGEGRSVLSRRERIAAGDCMSTETQRFVRFRDIIWRSWRPTAVGCVEAREL